MPQSSMVSYGVKCLREVENSVAHTSFGGPWTLAKLEILRLYPDAYTTALKPTRFRLVYADAFAGEGSWAPNEAYDNYDYADFRELHAGSPVIALEIKDKPFDRLIFIEKDPDRSAALHNLDIEFQDRDITVINDDANLTLPAICSSLAAFDRAVMFLDPFATEVSWESVSAIAGTQKVDCWILFPLMAIARMMPGSSEPNEPLARYLDRIFGARYYWEGVYQPSAQLSLFGEQHLERLQGSDHIALLYRERLESVFQEVAPTRRVLRNSRNSPMFELFFAASNPRGARIAVNIADHILRNW